MDPRRMVASILAREQRAFLARSRRHWAPHLEAVRAFLGEGLASARAGALVLGAGSGLEVPWAKAPPGTVGWDAEPWSRVRTCLRHRVWAPWVFEDLTGGLGELWRTAQRTARQPWSGRVRATSTARKRLAGLIASLEPGAEPLARWLEARRPGTVLAANVMGQFGVLARRTVERAFGGRSPWVEEEGEADALDEALQLWTARCVGAFLGVLAGSGADLWLVHDRGVLFGTARVELGPLCEPWTAQLIAAEPLEADDPLCGVDVAGAFPGRAVDHQRRWLWQVAAGQTHVMEALRIQGIAGAAGEAP